MGGGERGGKVRFDGSTVPPFHLAFVGFGALNRTQAVSVALGV